MAVLNLCLCAKVPTTTISNPIRTTSLQQNSAFHFKPLIPSISVPGNHAPQGIETRSLWESISKVSLIAVLSTSIVLASNPALAFKGGGPYGVGVTRGQDLSGKDLIKQDFKTANLSNANLERALATGNTSFKGSTITGADFTDVPLRDDQREYLCKVADGVNPVTGNETRETLLCR